MKRVPIIVAGPDTRTAAASEAWEANWHVRYVPPVPQVPPVVPVTLAMATSVMTKVIMPAPPMAPSPSGEISPSYPPETEHPHFDEGSPHNELFQPRRIR